MHVQLDGSGEKIYTNYTFESAQPGREKVMVFLNSFLSYLILMLVFAAAGGLAIFLGITLRKKKNQKEAGQESTEGTN